MKIAAVKTGAVGDLIQITPALAALRKKYLQSEITLVCGAEYAHVLKNHPAVTDILTFNSRKLYSRLMPFEALNVLRLLRNFDSVYIFHTDAKWHLIGRLTGAKCSVKATGTPRCLWHLKTVNAGLNFGYSYHPEPLTVKLPAKPYIALAAGGGRNFRRYTPQKIWDKQAELALKIVQETDYCVALLGTEEDRFRTDHPKIFDYTGRTTLSDCFHIIAGAVRYIGCDSGLTHLAACTDTPVTSIFGATNPKECAPPNISNIIMSKRPCAPCEKDGTHACPENMCMQAIDVDEVFSSI
ncbi:glycosyltransferase family 9 protein [Seleniivibrio woodruffii]|uniref:glycosyltransferase family 9 protein n=1 Tax=Seleniivibrio woodruffii TaxID=1078050 RepID=UPI0026F1FCE0|nr:glycosyltransferase family 9 protein [Seleniivibrio woodruffii]